MTRQTTKPLVLLVSHGLTTHERRPIVFQPDGIGPFRQRTIRMTLAELTAHYKDETLRIPDGAAGWPPDISNYMLAVATKDLDLDLREVRFLIGRENEMNDNDVVIEMLLEGLRAQQRQSANKVTVGYICGTRASAHLMWPSGF